MAPIKKINSVGYLAITIHHIEVRTLGSIVNIELLLGKKRKLGKLSTFGIQCARYIGHFWQG